MKPEEDPHRYLNWWYCENLVAPEQKDQAGLLHLGEPRVFLLIKDVYKRFYCTFEEFCDNITELNFLDAGDREIYSEEYIMIEAWNFLKMEEEAEEEAYDDIIIDEELYGDDAL